MAQIHRQIGRAIAAASRRPAACQAISPSSFSYSILPNGQGQGHLHGEVHGALEVITIQNGVDLLALIRTVLGTDVQIIPTAHASARADNPPAVEFCDPELVDPLDRDGAVSGFRIVELPNLGGGYANASAINSAGLVVGQSNLAPHGPLRACYWAEEGVPNEIATGSLSSWAVDVNDSGEIAGTLHIADGGTRAFLATATGIVTSETLGGFHANAHAMNSYGQVVGGSWSIPGNTLGDKRERAFKWAAGHGFQDLGALGDDWCARAVDINDHGAVVGHSHPRGILAGPSRAFIWTASGGFGDLGTLDGSPVTPVAINNREEVIGLASLEGRSVSFIWTRDRGMRPLALPNRSTVRAINDLGMIVYTREMPQGARVHVWSNGREIALPCYQGHQSEAAAINNRGDVVGHIWRGRHGHAVKWLRMD